MSVARDETRERARRRRRRRRDGGGGNRRRRQRTQAAQRRGARRRDWRLAVRAARLSGIGFFTCDRRAFALSVVVLLFKRRRAGARVETPPPRLERVRAPLAARLGARLVPPQARAAPVAGRPLALLLARGEHGKQRCERGLDQRRVRLERGRAEQAQEHERARVRGNRAGVALLARVGYAVVFAIRVVRIKRLIKRNRRGARTASATSASVTATSATRDAKTCDARASSTRASRARAARPRAPRRLPASDT